MYDYRMSEIVASHFPLKADSPRFSGTPISVSPILNCGVPKADFVVILERSFAGYAKASLWEAADHSSHFVHRDICYRRFGLVMSRTRVRKVEKNQKAITEVVFAVIKAELSIQPEFIENGCLTYKINNREAKMYEIE